MNRFVRCFKPSLTIFLLAFLLLPSGTRAQEIGHKTNLIRESVNHEKLDLISGKSIILRSDLPIQRVSISNPEVADFIMLSEYEVYITGKTAGIANMIVWKKNTVTDIYDIQVEYDLTRLKQQLHQILPEETQVQVVGSNDSFTLFGKVSNAINLSQIVSLASSYAPEAKINNLLEVGGIHQVMLEVCLAEMSKSAGKTLGINLLYTRDGEFGTTMLGGLHSFEVDKDGWLESTFSATTNYISSWTAGQTNWTTFIEALQEDGQAKILAEPTLIALSGQSASFLAGGEFPIPIPDNDRVTIHFKEFGVGLTFKPIVLSQDKINITVKAEVSELDFSTALQYSGYVVPGLSTRNAATTIDLADGQSFAIAGLLKEDIKTNIQKYPFLGDIPILGTLFKSKSFQKDETELIIVVTARLVKPFDKKGLPLPTDNYKEPDHIDFFLNTGDLFMKTSTNPLAEGTLDGEFGHSIAPTE